MPNPDYVLAMVRQRANAKLAAADKLLQRSPDDFQSFVAAAAEDGPVDTVFIDGRMLMQSGMAPRLAELSPSVVEQLDRAILTGGDIAIPGPA